MSRQLSSHVLRAMSNQGYDPRQSRIPLGSIRKTSSDVHVANMINSVFPGDDDYEQAARIATARIRKLIEEKQTLERRLSIACSLSTSVCNEKRTFRLGRDERVLTCPQYTDEQLATMLGSAKPLCAVSIPLPDAARRRILCLSQEIEVLRRLV